MDKILTNFSGILLENNLFNVFVNGTDQRAIQIINQIKEIEKNVIRIDIKMNIIKQFR